MSNLVPEPRVDVNGRVVTRHVRSEQPPVPPRRSVPHPPSGARTTHTALADIVYGIVQDYLPMRSYSPIYKTDVHLDRASVKSYVTGIPQDIVVECLDQILSSETDTGYATLLVSAVHRREESDMLSNVTFLYDPENESVANTEWNHELSIAENHLFLRRIVKGMEKYSRWGLDLSPRFKLASDQQQKIVSALYKTTDFISFELDPKYLHHGSDSKGEIDSLSLKDRVLFDVVTTYPDRMDEVIQLLESRGCDGELLAEYFARQPPLRNGIL